MQTAKIVKELILLTGEELRTFSISKTLLLFMTYDNLETARQVQSHPVTLSEASFSNASFLH